jgi:hypothetical protein
LGRSSGRKNRENKTSFELFLRPFNEWNPPLWKTAESCNS